MFIASFAAGCSRLRGRTLSGVIRVGKSTCKSTAVKKTQNSAVSKATGAYVKGYSPGTAGSAYAAAKQNLSFWRLTT
jgi:hypothetical protein